MSKVKEEKLKCYMKGSKTKQKKRRKKKITQVLMKSKVKFVSAVGVYLLTSSWIHLWFSFSSRFYCLTLEKNKIR